MHNKTFRDEVADAQDLLLQRDGALACQRGGAGVVRYLLRRRRHFVPLLLPLLSCLLPVRRWWMWRRPL